MLPRETNERLRSAQRSATLQRFPRKRESMITCKFSGFTDFLPVAPLLSETKPQEGLEVFLFFL